MSPRDLRERAVALGLRSERRGKFTEWFDSGGLGVVFKAPAMFGNPHMWAGWDGTKNRWYPSDRMALSAVVARLDPEWCPESDDGRHCEHWHDCEDCHTCGAPYLPDPLCDCPKCTAARDGAPVERAP